MTTDCRRTLDRLPSYVDDVLSSDEQQEVQRHLASCTPCRAAAVAERGGRLVLREKSATLRSEPLPPGLRSRCEALAREGTQPSAARAWWSGFVPGSVTAVVVFITMLGMLAVATQQSDSVLAAQLAADHAKCFRLFASSDSPAADAQRLEQMLRDQYGWAMHVPPSSPGDGVQLIGARRCIYADGLIPHVMYRVNGQDVSLYMLDGVTRNVADVISLGHRSHIWTRGDRTYVLVASAAAGELAKAVSYVMREAQ